MTQLLLNCNRRYSPGSTVQGNLVYSVKEPIKCRGIAVKLTGRARVRWQDVDDWYYFTVTHTYQNLEKCVDASTIVWTGDLPIGDHTFPFTFQLPQEIPNSFDGDYGQIWYEVDSIIVQDGRANSLKKVNISIDGGISTEVLNRYTEPVRVTKNTKLKLFCADRGSVSATVKMLRACFSPGESLPITVDISNESSKRIRIASVLNVVKAGYGAFLSFFKEKSCSFFLLVDKDDHLSS